MNLQEIIDTTKKMCYNVSCIYMYYYVEPRRGVTACLSWGLNVGCCFFGIGSTLSDELACIGNVPIMSMEILCMR